MDSSQFLARCLAIIGLAIGLSAFVTAENHAIKLWNDAEFFGVDIDINNLDALDRELALVFSARDGLNLTRLGRSVWQKNLLDIEGNHDWLLLLDYPLVDFIEVILVTPERQYYWQTGDSIPPDMRNFWSYSFVIDLPDDIPSGSMLYIGYHGKSPKVVRSLLIEHDQLQKHQFKQLLWIGIAAGLMLTLVGFNLIQGLVKDRSCFNWLASSQMLMTIGLLYLTGVGQAYLWPQSAWMQNLIGVFGLNGTALVTILSFGYLSLRNRRSLMPRSWNLSYLVVFILISVLGELFPGNWGYLFFLIALLTALIQLIRAVVELKRAKSLLTLLFLYTLWLLSTQVLLLVTKLNLAVILTMALTLFFLQQLHSWVFYWHDRSQKLLELLELKESEQSFSLQAEDANRQLSELQRNSTLSYRWNDFLGHKIYYRLSELFSYMDLITQGRTGRQGNRLLADAITYTEDLMYLDALMHRDMKPVHDVFTIEQLSNEIRSFYEERSHAQKLYFGIESSAPLSQLFEGNFHLLRTLVCRCVDNAFDNTENGFIKLLIKQEASNDKASLLRLEIKDSGHGLNDEQTQSILKFWQGNELERSPGAEGIGSGLALAVLIARHLDARFQLQSSPEAGSTFIFQFWLPHVHDNGEQRQYTRVLLIEDSATHYQLIQTACSELSLHLTWAKTFEHAEQQLQQQKFDGIVADFDAISGEFSELVDQVMACDAAQLSDTPLLVIHRQTDTPSDFNDKKVFDQLSKPLQMESLRAWIRALRD